MYTEIRPKPALRPWVECFWTKRDGGEGSARVLPDGCADLVFDLDSGEGMAVGTMTRPLVVPNAGRHLGVRFRPGRAAAFLRIPLAEITDARVPLRELVDEFDLDKLEQVLLARLAPAPPPDPRVAHAVSRILATAGTARIDDVARDANLSRQHLARQFATHVGVSPKTFARVVRFRSVVDATNGAGTVDWADVALVHGYYDQAHLIGEFRELAGVTPEAWVTTG
jgi:AraC-like DNA-binding protein